MEKTQTLEWVSESELVSALDQGLLIFHAILWSQIDTNLLLEMTKIKKLNREIEQILKSCVKTSGPKMA